MSGAAGVGACQKGHDMGARCVGDPGFVSGDTVVITVFGGAGPQGAQI